MARAEGARDRLALRCIEVTHADARHTIEETYPVVAVERSYDIDARAMQLLNQLRDHLPADSELWPAIEEFERSIDLGLTRAIPVEADTEVVEPLPVGAPSDG